MDDAPHADDYGISVLICVMSTLGVVFNGYGIIIVLYNPVLSNVFGKLCFSHSVANLGVCAIFLVWGVPLTLTQNTAFATSIFGKILGQINIFFWGLCVYSHLFISINRFLTITFPIKTVVWTTSIRIRLFISAPWILSFLHIIPYFVYDVCYMAYLPTNWTWIWSETTCGQILSNYVDKYSWFAIFLIMFVLDLLTAYFFRKNQKMTTESGFDDQASVGAISRARQRQKREIRFFIQSCIQGAIFFYELTNFYILTKLDNNQYYVFFTSTFAWILCHMLDGLVLICFNFKGYQDHRRSSVHSLRPKPSQMMFTKTTVSGSIENSPK